MLTNPSLHVTWQDLPVSHRISQLNCGVGELGVETESPQIPWDEICGLLNTWIYTLNTNPVFCELALNGNIRRLWAFGPLFNFKANGLAL